MPAAAVAGFRSNGRGGTCSKEQKDPRGERPRAPRHRVTMRDEGRMTNHPASESAPLMMVPPGRSRALEEQTMNWRSPSPNSYVYPALRTVLVPRSSSLTPRSAASQAQALRHWVRIAGTALTAVTVTPAGATAPRRPTWTPRCRHIWGFSGTEPRCRVPRRWLAARSASPPSSTASTCGTLNADPPRTCAASSITRPPAWPSRR